MYPLDDTIAAIASPPGGAARGVVRISGPQALDCLMQFFQPDGGAEKGDCPHLPERPEGCFAQMGTVPFFHALRTRHFPHVVIGSLHLPELHSPLPCDAYLWSNYVAQPPPAVPGDVHSRGRLCHIPQVRSYTGQPVVEIHTLGSPPLLQIVLRSLCAAGARLAGPGEFTLRAFLAGRIDLTQAEAVLGVIDAGDSRELDIALGQLAGGLGRPLHRLREALLDLLAHLEAGFDFADEDLAFLTREELGRRLAAAESDLAAMHRQMASRSEPIDAVRAVLVGRPNTGKSSLFNVLAGDRAALVSDQPGTTRDYLIAELDLDGVNCRLIDTAGARGEGREERGEGWAVHRPLGYDIDQAAESASAEQRRAAHVQVLCLDATRPLDAWERSELARAAEGQRIVVLTKCDATRQTDCTHTALETSSQTGHGIAALRRQLRQRALAAGEKYGDVVVGTALRCADSLRLAGQCLQRARQVAAAGQEELAAAEMRVAITELGKAVGAVYTDDVLDRIFSRFCVGK